MLTGHFYLMEVLIINISCTIGVLIKTRLSKYTEGKSNILNYNHSN